MGFKEENTEERLRFVDFWANYVREHDDKEWSRQQNLIINSCLRSARITKDVYLKLKS